jgi:NADPH:quinone reductase-like Zn-dependent oxidoreductase
MRAVVMTAVGRPDVLKLAEVAEPEITGEHDVKVRLHAARINPADYKFRAGGTIGGILPAVLGWDGAGVVEDIGTAVTRFRPGDAVYFCDGGWSPSTPGRRSGSGPGSPTGSECWSRPPPISTRVTCASWSAGRSRWPLRLPRTARWKPAR